jgi:hypothetical protein
MPNQDLQTRLSSIPGAPDLPEVRRQLREFVQAAAISDRYAWAFPDVGSTDEFVYDYLVSHPYEPLHDPCLYQEHLSEGSSLLDRCLARRDQIYALESAATTTALDYLLAESTQDGELALARVALKATRAQAGADASDAGDTVLAAQFDSRTNARNVRLALHAQDGNPLNYRQRIGDLRELFADDVRSIYERLTRARIGMNQAGVARNLPKVPDWDKGRRDNLKRLVLWCREAIRQVELNSVKEIVYKCGFSLVGDKLVPLAEFNSKVTTSDLVSFKFRLEQQKHFLRKGPHRILDLGVAVAGIVMVSATAGFSQDPAVRAAEQERREAQSERAKRDAMTLAFFTSTALPPQSSQFADEQTYTWTRPPLIADGETQVWQSLGEQKFPAGSTTSVFNTNPLGDWEIWLGGNYRMDDGSVHPRSYLRTGNPGWTISDIILFMTVASLRTG